MKKPIREFVVGLIFLTLLLVVTSSVLKPQSIGGWFLVVIVSISSFAIIKTIAGKNSIF